MFGSSQRKPPKKTHTKLSRVLLHVLRPPGVVYVQAFACAFGRLSHTKGVCAMYSHEYLKHISTSSTSSLARSTFVPRVHFALRPASLPNSSVHVLRTYIFVPPRFTTLHHALMHLHPDHHPLPNALSRRFAPRSTNGRIRSLIIDWLPHNVTHNRYTYVLWLSPEAHTTRSYLR